MQERMGKKKGEKSTRQLKLCRVSAGLFLGSKTSGILYTKQEINAKKERKNNTYDAKRKNNTGTY